VRNMKDLSVGGKRLLLDAAGNMAMSAFVRYSAWRRTHPMSGGILRVRRDGAKDFVSLRKNMFGFERSPLPRSLQLPAAENRTNELLARSSTR